MDDRLKITENVCIWFNRFTMGVEILTAVEVNCKPIGQVFEFTDVLQYWISGFNQER